MISDIEPGRQVFDPEQGVKRWDYRHLLPEGADPRLRLWVREAAPPPGFGPDEYRYLYVRLYRGTALLGSVDGCLESGSLAIEASNLHEKYRGRGIGLAMYEALLAHAYHRHGCRTAGGHGHSPLAHRVHLRLAEKHGTGYAAAYWRSMKQWDKYRHRLA